ncbi:MAG: hypothetical protein ACRCXZ_01000 [Patescibacteria group bacterium]
MTTNSLMTIQSEIPFQFTNEGRPDRPFDTRPIFTFACRHDYFPLLVNNPPFEYEEDGLGPAKSWFLLNPLLTMPIIILELLYTDYLSVEYDIYAEDRGLVLPKVLEYFEVSENLINWKHPDL